MAKYSSDIKDMYDRGYARAYDKYTTYRFVCNHGGFNSDGAHEAYIEYTACVNMLCTVFGIDFCQINEDIQNEFIKHICTNTNA